MARVQDSQLYRNFPALWKIKSDDYKNRLLKSECYVKLIEKLREIDPSTTRSTVTKKINSLRSNYRRELKKVLNSMKSGAGVDDDIYTPSLWYFDDLSFLRDQEVQQPGVSSMDDEIDDNVESIDNIVSIYPFIYMIN